MTKPLDLRFVMSAAAVEQLPRLDREVAIVGRSNVGKSSLLNALAGRRQLAKTSSTPGRTRLLNLFALGDAEPPRTAVVDLPGYGYAKGARGERDAWAQRQSRYLLDRDSLVTTLLLVDGVIGPVKNDATTLAWFREHDVAFVVVATKHDKVKPSQRQRRRRDLAGGCDVAPGDVRWVSATKGTGVEALRGEVVGLLEG